MQLLAVQETAAWHSATLHVSIGCHVSTTLVCLQTVVCACAVVPTGELQGRLLMRKAVSMPSLQVLLGLPSFPLVPSLHDLNKSCVNSSCWVAGLKPCGDMFSYACSLD